MRSSSISVRRGLVLVAVLLGAAILSGYFRDLSRAFTAEGSYAERRTEFAFRGVDFDRIRESLGNLLPQSTPVMVGPRLSDSSFWVQRLTETLYPRPVVARAEHVLEPGPGSIVTGPDVGPRESPPPVEDLTWSPLALLAGTLAALGFGLATRGRLLPDRQAAPALILGAAVVRGALVLGLLASLATWIRLPLPPRFSLATGLALSLVAAVGIWAGRETWRSACIRPKPESLIPLLLVAGTLVYLVAFPGALWDGRSIWLFHAKQIAMNGLLPAAELARPELQWSHPEYPLLYPAWLAQFTAAKSVYSERAASLGIAVLLAAVLAIVWRLSRDLLGRWYGMALPLVAFFGAAHGILGAYADGVTMFLLLGAVLGFLRRETHGVGWLCAVAASLTKFEGLLFALVIVATFAALRKLRPVWPAALFLPAIVHAVWGRWVGLGSDFDGMRPVDALASTGDRLAVIGEQLWFVLRTGDYNRTYGLLWVGGVCFVAATVRVSIGRRWRSDAARVLLLSGGLAGLVLLTLLVSPRDLDWLTQTAMDRLLLHPAALGMLSLLLAVRELAESREPR